MIVNRKIKDISQTIFSERVYVFAIILLAIGLPVSPFLVGFSQFLLGLVWLFSSPIVSKIKAFKSSKALQFFLILFFIHIIWLLNTSNFSYAIHDIKIKLPLFILPIIFATGFALSKNQIKKILLYFVATVVVGTFISFFIYLGFTSKEIVDVRQISIFISHIRFGLMIVFSIFILGYYLRLNYYVLPIWKRIIYFLTIIWFLIFLLILQAATSWVIMGVLLLLLIAFYYKKLKLKVMRIGAFGVLLLVPTFSFSLIILVVHNFFNVAEIDKSKLPTHTKLGNKYYHNTKNKAIENGNYVWVNYCSKEIDENWNKYSDISIKGKDAKGQLIKFTLVRYLTSKKLTKDAEGLSQLDEEDIKLIELGCASCVYKKTFTPYVKLYEIVWELNQYLNSGNANGKSLSLRVEFFKAGINIVKNNLWFGVGTGDVQEAFDGYYNETASKLKPKYRLRAHNQYLTFFITFGLFGFMLAMFAFFRPIALNGYNYTALVFVFISIIVLSMLNEDTFETQSGATFFAYFYSLLILNPNKLSD